MQLIPFDVVANAIAKVMDIPAASVRRESTLAEVGMDSLDALQLMLTLEEATGIQVEEQEVKKLTTVQSIIEVLVSHLSATAPAPSS